jgi:cell division transport system permease protein
MIIVLSGRLSAVGAALLDQGGLGWQGWLMLILLPAGAVGLAIVTARWTVVRALARML